MIVTSSLYLVVLLGLTAGYVPPGEFFQNKEDHSIFLNIWDTVIQRDIDASSEEVQSRKGEWWQGWREHISTQVDGFSFYDGIASEDYWKESHQFTSRSTQAYALLETFTLEFLAYAGEEGQLQLDPQVRLQTLESICPTLGIKEEEISDLHNSLVRTYEDVSKGSWQKFLDAWAEAEEAQEEWLLEHPLVSVFPTSFFGVARGLRDWFESDAPDVPSAATSERTLYALEKTKEVVLYETLIEDQRDRALAQELLQRQAREQEELRRQIEEQKETLEALRAADDEVKRKLAPSGAGTLVIPYFNNGNEEIRQAEYQLRRLQQLLSISITAQESMVSREQKERH